MASPQERAGASSASDVAIIGMACRFPGAHGAAELWTLLRDGGEALVALSDDELRASGTPESLSNPRQETHLQWVLRVGDSYLAAGLHT